MIRGTLAAGASALALAGAAAAQTPAEEDAREARLRELEQRVAELEAQDAAARAPAPAADAVRVTLGNGRPTLESADKAFRVSLRSIVQFDAADYDQGPGANVDLSSGTNFRRARFGVEGAAFTDWNYELIFEFGGSGQEDPGKLLAGWIEYAGFESARVRVGAMAPSINLDDATSSGDILFLERGAAAEMARGLAAGDGRSAVALIGGGERWFGSAALTGAVAGAGASFDEQAALVARLAGLALNSEALALHVGANHSSVLTPPDTSFAAGDDSLRLQERPELRVDGTRLVDTGALTADGMTITGLEAGLQAGRLLATAEAIRFEVDRTGALADASFGGWHVQAAWSLTGEQRRWSARTGGFASARPAHNFDPEAGHWGAWEAAARYSVLDLNDHETDAGLASTLGAPTEIVRGGEQRIATLGLNWRPNALVRVMLNYQSIDIERLDAAGAAEIGQSLDAVSVRTQFAF